MKILIELEVGTESSVVSGALQDFIHSLESDCSEQSLIHKKIAEKVYDQIETLAMECSLCHS